ncbi:MAG: hypothetical protein J6328_04705 [Bacilli bacterium]|nr:hypothetical protein [Bacilli bacterium]
MAAVKLGNFLYWLFIAFFLLFGFAAFYLSKRFGKRFAHRFILVMVWTNFAFHFLKQLNPAYMRAWPEAWMRSTPENLCAFLVMAAPFIYLWGNKYFKDYLVFFGFWSGVAAIMIPTGPMEVGLNIQTSEGLLEVLRYYFCHIPLSVTAVLMVAFDLHKLDYRRLWAMPLMIMSVFLIIFLDLLLFVSLGLQKADPFWMMFDRNFYNPSMAMGPTRPMDPIVGWTYPVLAFPFRFHLPNGELAFIPALWPVFYLYLIGVPFALLCYLPFEHRHMKEDLIALRLRAKNKQHERNV